LKYSKTRTISSTYIRLVNISGQRVVSAEGLLKGRKH